MNGSFLVEGQKSVYLWTLWMTRKLKMTTYLLTRYVTPIYRWVSILIGEGGKKGSCESVISLKDRTDRDQGPTFPLILLSITRVFSMQDL